MAKAKDDTHRGYRARFDAAGQTLRERSQVSTCPEPLDSNVGVCGMPMEVTQTWRASDRGDGTLYRIQGVCSLGHMIERYGFGEAIG